MTYRIEYQSDMGWWFTKQSYSGKNAQIYSILFVRQLIREGYDKPLRIRKFKTRR